MRILRHRHRDSPRSARTTRPYGRPNSRPARRTPRLRAQEAAEQAGFIQDYKVLTTEAHGATDWNLLLMTEAKDLASVEANQEKVDAMMQKVVGDDQKQMQGYKDRESMREPFGSRVAREIVLEPKP